MKKMKNILSLAAIFYMASQTIAVGETITWTGTTAGDLTWDTATNWDTGTAPTTVDTVVLNTSGTTVTLEANKTYEVDTLTFQCWGEFDLKAVAPSTGENYATLKANTIDYKNGGYGISNVILDVGTFTVTSSNNELTYIQAGSTIDTLNLNCATTSSKFFLSYSTLSVGTLTGTSTEHQLILVNNSTLTLTGTGTFDGAFGTNYGSNRTGTLIIASGADQTFTGVAMINTDEGKVNDYTYQIYGKFTVNDTTGIELEVYNGGTLKFGDETLSAESIWFEDGAKLELSSVNVTSLDTILDMALIDSTGTVELVFTYGLISGGEYQISLFKDGTDIGSLLFESDWFDDYEYDSSTGDLSFIAISAVVPEPSTYALIFGALALGLVAYRRRLG